MQTTIIVIAADTLPALNRIVSLLRGRNFGVESITIGHAGAETSHITLVLDTSRTPARRMIACLERLHEVRRVYMVEPEQLVTRELALLKVWHGPDTDATLAALVASGKAQIIDRTGDRSIVEVVCEPSDIDNVTARLHADELLVGVRIGPLAMHRGSVGEFHQ